MKFSIAGFLASSLASSVCAASVHGRHQEFHAKREASEPAPAPSANSSSCGCYTYTTTWYGEAGLVPDTKTYSTDSTATVTPTTSLSSEYVAPTNYAESTISSSYFAPYTSTSETPSSSSIPTSTSSSSAPETYTTPEIASTSSSSIWVVPTYYAPPSSYAASKSTSFVSSSAAPSSTSGSSGTISPNGNQWAFCYTPYGNDGTCKSASQVSSDVATIKAKGFTTIRLYATDCSGPENVGTAAAANGLKLILGIYIDESGIGSNTDEQIDTLTKWGSDKWDMVEMVVAGNEAVFYGYASAAQLASFILDVKSKFQAAGYSGPVGTTEPLVTFQENANILCPAVDYAGANIHPYFNTDVSAEAAGDFVAQQLDDLAAACNNEKEAYNLESGWPSSGLANGLAIPGATEQKAALEGILSAAGSKSAVFSFENDTWKDPGPFDVEQYWGCANLFDG